MKSPTEESTPLLAKDAVKSSSNRSRYLSLFLIYLTMCLIFLQRTIFWPSLWPYLTTIQPGVTPTFYGIINMSNSLASAFVAPIYGFLANKMGQVKFPAVFGITVNCIGHVIFVFSETFPVDYRAYMVLVARVVSGLGTGAFGCLYAYLATASTKDERNVVMSIRSSVSSFALMVGPALQAAFVPIGYPAVVRGNFRLNMYTAPAYFSLFINICLILMLIFIFKEHRVPYDGNKTEQMSSVEISTSVQPYDKLAAAVCLGVRFVVLFSYSFDNTIGSAFTMIMFQWTQSQAVLYNGIIQAVSGLLDFGGNLFVGIFVLKYVRERSTIIFGLAGLFLFYAFSFPWPGKPFLGVQDDLAMTLNGTMKEQGTPCTYDWCAYTPRIDLWQYILAYVCLLSAFSIAFSPNATLYSKIIGPHPQGFSQGLFITSGNLATAAGPIICSSLFHYYGPRVAWITGAAVVVVYVIPILLTYKRLLPFGDTHKPKTDSITTE